MYSAVLDHYKRNHPSYFFLNLILLCLLVISLLYTTPLLLYFLEPSTFFDPAKAPFRKWSLRLVYVIITHSADSRHKANIMDDDLLNDLDSLGDDDEKGSDNEEISGEANGDDENASKSTASNIMSLIKSSKKDKDSLSSLRRSIQ